jgi:hypothetical protein
MSDSACTWCDVKLCCGVRGYLIVRRVDVSTLGEELVDEAEPAVTRRHVESCVASLRWRSGGKAAMEESGGNSRP